MKRHATLWPAALLLLAVSAAAQDRDTQVRNDREQLGADKSWVYDDLETGLRVARREARPVLVMFR